MSLKLTLSLVLAATIVLPASASASDDPSYFGVSKEEREKIQKQARELWKQEQQIRLQCLKTIHPKDKVQ